MYNFIFLGWYKHLMLLRTVQSKRLDKVSHVQWTYNYKNNIKEDSRLKVGVKFKSHAEYTAKRILDSNFFC